MVLRYQNNGSLNTSLRIESISTMDDIAGCFRVFRHNLWSGIHFHRSYTDKITWHLPISDPSRLWSAWFVATNPFFWFHLHLSHKHHSPCPHQTDISINHGSSIQTTHFETQEYPSVWMKIAMMLSIDLDLVLWDDKVDNQSIQAQIFHRDTTRYLHYSFQVLFPLSSWYYYTIKNDFLFFVPHPRIIPLTLIVVVSSGQTCNIDSCYLHDNPPTSCIVTLHSFLTPDLLSFLLAPSDIDHALSMLSPFR